MAELPESFPTDKWDDMTPEQQRLAAQRSGLTKAEQWTLLNANVSVGTLATIQDIEANRGLYGLSRAEAASLTDKLWQLGSAKFQAKRHALPFSFNYGATATFLKIVDEREAALLDGIGYGKRTLPYLGELPEYEVTPDGRRIVRIEPAPQEQWSQVYSAHDQFNCLGVMNELSRRYQVDINPDSPYMSDLLADAQAELDARDHTKPMRLDEMRTLLADQVQQDMARNPVATKIRIGLPNTPGGRTVNYALDYFGLPYDLGGKNPEKGALDCSGLVRQCVLEYAAEHNPEAFIRLQKEFTGSASSHARKCRPQGTVVLHNPTHNRNIAIPLNKLQPGDIVYWYSTEQEKIGHTGLYMGNDQVIEASSMRNDSGVVVRDLSSRNSYDKLIIDAIVRPDIISLIPSKEQP